MNLSYHVARLRTYLKRRQRKDITNVVSLLQVTFAMTQYHTAKRDMAPRRKYELKLCLITCTLIHA